MILGIDVGNTNIVLGCLNGLETVSSARICTNKNGTAYEYAFSIKSALEFNGVEMPELEGAIISSVVPPVTMALRDALDILGVKKTLVVGAGIKTGLNIKIDDPAELGSDLVVGAVASLAVAEPPLITIDLGTATTICAMDRSGAFLGGAIAPGVVLSMDALAGGASLLPKVPIIAPKKAIGTNTVSCMQSGAVIGAAAMLDGMIERMEKELGERAAIVATGGLATSVVPNCTRKDIIIEPDLLLKGLAVLWEKNSR